MERKEIMAIVNTVFKKEFEKRAKIACSPEYYKNIFLQYAMEHHNSTQCIVRTYLEMLKAAYPLIKRPFDSWEINQSLIYINTFQNRKMLKYIDKIMSERAEEFEAFSQPSYIIKTTEDRFKCFRSHIAKIRTCEVTEETLVYLKDFFNSITDFEEFTASDKKIAKKILQDMWNDNYKKTPTKDMIGYRDIIYGYDNSTEDTVTIPFVYQLMNYSKDFFREKGFDLIVSKDYIKNPKNDTGYQSLHATFNVLGTNLELQGRTGIMHEEAKRGKYNHDKIYKDKLIQHFFSDFMYDISTDLNCVTRHEDIGILKELSLSNMPICKTPNSEVPKTPSELVPFPGTKLIEANMKISPQFSDIS